MTHARTASLAEASAIAGLVNAAFQVEAFFKRGDRTRPDEIRHMMRKGEFLVVDAEGASAAACVYLKINGPTAYFGMLSVDPAVQGRGIGRSLIDAVEARAAAAGCDTMEIHIVDLREELPPYYQRLGYVETGRLPFPAEEEITRPCEFIVMTKPLRSGIR